MSFSILVDALGWTLLHFLWQGAAIALVLAVGLRVAVRSVPQVRYAMACGGLILMAGMMAMTFGWELTRDFGGRAPRAGAPAAHAQVFPDAQPPHIPFAPVTGVASDVGVPMVTPVVERSSERMDARRRVEWAVGNCMAWVVRVWSMGAMVLAIRLFTSWRAVRKLQKGARAVAEPEWMERVGRLAKRVGISRPVRLLVSGAAAVPMVIGLLRPAILVPASLLTEMSVAQLEAILAHELAHIRRHDYLMHHFQSLVEVVGYYHPAVWWVSGKVRAEREHCCDDMASAVAGKLDYAQALTALEEYRGSRLMLAATGGSLLQRIRRLAGLPAPTENSRAVWPLGVLALLIGAGLVLAVLPAGAQTPATQSTQAASRPTEDYELTIEFAKDTSLIPDMLPPQIILTVTNTSRQPVQWNIDQQGELLVDGKPSEIISLSDTRTIRTGSLAPGEHYTGFPATVKDYSWTDRRPKILQWRFNTRLSNTLTWQVNPDLQARILQALSKTAKPADVEQYLHGLRLIGRDALTAGLKDVLSPQRPEVKAVLQGGKDYETIMSAFLAAEFLPGTATPDDLAPFVGNADRELRSRVASGFGWTRTDKPKAVALLHEMLDGEDARAGSPSNHAVIKMDACISLSQLGDRGSGIPIMIGLLSQKETLDLHGWIRSTLKQFTGKAFTEDQQWIDWWKAGGTATAPDTTQAASPPDGVVDGVLSVVLKAPPSPIDGMLPPDLAFTASNATGEPITWDFLKGELLADGKPWSSFTFPYNGPVGRSWSSLLPGEQFTYILRLPEDLWKDGRPKVLQWRVGDHLSKGATLTWKPNAELKGKILEVLSKTSQSMEVQQCLRGLQPIGRDALVAGLKDVLSAQRRGFTGESYQEATRSDALLAVRSLKLTELAPEVRAIVQLGKDDELVKQAALAAMCLPGTVTPSNLIPYMKKDDPIFRRYLAGVLGVTKEDRDKAVTMLHELLDQEDARPGKFEEHAFVKIWASQSLGKLGDRGGIPIMIQLLSREETKDFRGNIKMVLEEITGQSPKDDQQWIDWWKSQATGTPASAAAVGPAATPAATTVEAASAELRALFTRTVAETNAAVDHGMVGGENLFWNRDGKRLVRMGALGDLAARINAGARQEVTPELRVYATAAAGLLDDKDPGCRGMACAFFSMLGTHTVEVGRLPDVAAKLGDTEVAVKGVLDPMRAQQSLLQYREARREPTVLTVGELAQMTLVEATNIPFRDAETFRGWWKGNSNFESHPWYWAVRWSSLGNVESDLPRLFERNPKTALALPLLANSNTCVSDEAHQPMIHTLSFAPPPPASVAALVKKYKVRQQLVEMLTGQVAGNPRMSDQEWEYLVCSRVLPILAAASTAEDTGEIRGLLQREPGMIATSTQLQIGLTRLAAGLDPDIAASILREQLTRHAGIPSLAADLVKLTGTKDWAKIKASYVHATGSDSTGATTLIGTLATLKGGDGAPRLAELMEADHLDVDLKDDGMPADQDTGSQARFLAFVKAAEMLHGGRPVVDAETVNKALEQRAVKVSQEDWPAYAARNRAAIPVRREVVAALLKYFREAR